MVADISLGPIVSFYSLCGFPRKNLCSKVSFNIVRLSKSYILNYIQLDNVTYKQNVWPALLTEIPRISKI